MMGPAPNRKNKARSISTVMMQKELPPIASKVSMRGPKLPPQERPIKQALSETNTRTGYASGLGRAGTCDPCR